METRIITSLAQKGGVGKTTTTAALAQAAAYLGYKVLAVDLDPQANFTRAFNADANKPGADFLLTGKARATSLIQTAGKVDIIPASITLSTMETGKGTARRLKKALEPIAPQYDFVFLDAPTMPGEMLYNVLNAATDLIIPLWADIHSQQAYYQTTDTAREMQKYNEQLQIAGILFTMYDGRSTLAKQLRNNIERVAAADGVRALGAIRRGVAVQEAQALQQSLFDYAPKSNPARDYMDVFQTLFADDMQ